MKTDLDSRIADLQNRKRVSDAAAEKEVRGLEHAIEDAQQSLQSLQKIAMGIQSDTTCLDRRLSALRAKVSIWLAMVFAACIIIIVLALWSGAKIREAAVNEATLVRQQNAAEMEQVRQEGQDGIAALRAQMAEERNRVESEVAEAGAELANLSDELAAGRAELQQFIALKDRTGFDLFDYRGRTLIVVAEGQEIRSWRAPGLSNFARYNGQMYRIFD